MGTTLKSLIMSFTKSIDLYNYLLKNHHRRVAIIAYHHWRYDQDHTWVGYKGCVPIESYILHVADRIDILIDTTTAPLVQKDSIIETICSYSNTLFHPDVVKSFVSEAHKDNFWLDIDNLTMKDVLEKAISDFFQMEMNMDLLEQFAYTISKIIDCRSKFTTSHSFGVSAVAFEIAELMHYSDEKKREIRVAGLLHDIGKIAIPSELIEKNGALSLSERSNVQTHAYFTDLILKDVDGLDEIAAWASHHHENHDGSGYPENLTEKTISEEMDILSYADIYTALSEDRPYRRGLSTQEIASVLDQQFKEKHGEKIYQLICDNLPIIDAVCKSAIRDGINRYQIYEELSKQSIREG